MNARNAHVICLLQQKGGVGKTTLAINLAAGFARRGENVLLVDADPQESAQDWSALRRNPTFPVVGMAKDTLHKELPALKAGYDRVIIDTAPADNEPAKSAIAASDFVLMPITPSPLSTWASDDTVNLVWQAQQRWPDIGAGFVVNMKRGGTRLSRQLAQQYVNQPFPVFDTQLRALEAYVTSVERGLSVFDLHSLSLFEMRSAHAAVADMTALMDEIINHNQQRKAA